MLFYRKCLGGELFLQTVGETPLAANLPKKMKQSILHATLINGNMMLMASDMPSDHYLNQGNRISIMLVCKSENEIATYYKKLSNGANIKKALEMSEQGAYFADIIDQYGLHWLLHFQPKINL